HASVEFAIEGMKLGAFDYMLKPIDIDDLVYKLQDAHKKKQIQEDKILRIKEKGVRVKEEDKTKS
ncbi:MAG: response regulator, partial [Pseudomonadota bacterium]